MVEVKADQPTMTTAEPRTQAIHEPVEETIRRLERFVARMERRYECPSAEATGALIRGELKETAEVSRWLISYRTLQRLRDLGREIGTSTTITR